MEKLNTPLVESDVCECGDCVVYRGYGICRIDAKEKLDFGDGEREYYVLRSVFDESATAYVPVGSPLSTQMRHILTKEDIDDVIGGATQSGNVWIDDGKLRSATFTQLVESGDRTDILWVIFALSGYRTELSGQRKKLYALDEKLLNSALRMIKEEFAFVLNIEREEVVPYINSKLGHDFEMLPSA